MKFFHVVAAFVLAFSGLPARADFYVPPGEVRLCYDLTSLADSGVIDVPLSTWPLSRANIERVVETLEANELSPHLSAALARVHRRLERETAHGALFARRSDGGRLEFGAGFDHLEDKVTDETDREVRGFFKWTVGRDALQ